MLGLEKWQQLLITILKHGSVSFNNQRIYNSRNAFYPIVKILLESSYIKLEKINNSEKFYSLTLKGEILARILR